MLNQVRRRIFGNVIRLNKSRLVSRPFSLLSKTNTQTKLSWNHLQRKQIQVPQICCYSTDNNNESNESNYERTLPRLVNKEIVIFPPVFAYLAVSRKVQTITQSIDPEFSLDDFRYGTKKAVEIISEKLASADFDGLRGLVTDEVIDELRPAIVSMSDEQRSRLRIKSHEINQFLVSSIEINENNDSTTVSIALIYEAIAADALDTRASSRHFVNSHLNNRYMLNYTFTKEFSPNSNDDWTVSFLNHVNMLDQVQAPLK